MTLVAIVATLALLWRHGLTAWRLSSLALLYAAFGIGVVLRFH